MVRHVFEDLDELPDDPRLGLRLLGIGVLVVALRYGWQHIAPSSFQVASAGIRHYSPNRYASTNGLGELLFGIAAMCFVSGGYIFFRKGFWWYAERRSERSITELKFK
jgi:hypothetical protein